MMHNMASFIYLLTALIVGLQFVDYYTTRVILQRGGVELNPIVRVSMRVFGINLGLFVAKLWAGGIIITGTYLGWFESITGIIVLGCVAIFYMTVVVHNYFEARR